MALMRAAFFAPKLIPIPRVFHCTMSSNATTDLRAALVVFSTCEISDALIKLGSPHGGHIPDIHMLSPSDSTVRLCGPAYTVQMVLGSDTSAPKLSAHFVDTAPEGSVVVINAPHRSVTSSDCWPYNVHARLTG